MDKRRLHFELECSTPTFGVEGSVVPRILINWSDEFLSISTEEKETSVAHASPVLVQVGPDMVVWRFPDGREQRLAVNRWAPLSSTARARVRHENVSAIDATLQDVGAFLNPMIRVMASDERWPNADQVEPLTIHEGDEFLIGNGMGSQPVHLAIANDACVSKIHARVQRRLGRYYVSDLGSSLGTFLGTQRLQGEHELKDGDQFRIGRTVVQFICHAPGALEERDRLAAQLAATGTLSGGQHDGGAGVPPKESVPSIETTLVPPEVRDGVTRAEQTLQEQVRRLLALRNVLVTMVICLLGIVVMLVWALIHERLSAASLA